MEKLRFCIKCRFSVKQWYIEEFGIELGVYCINEKCDRFGLLSYIWLTGDNKN